GTPTTGLHEGIARVAYGAKDISILKGLQPVRERPGMYIGSTGPSGLHHLVYEVVDNSVDEALAGYATRIDVSLLADGGCRVVDNGRGIPVEPHPGYPDKSAAEIVLTMLHAGGKFGGEGHKISGGVHGGGGSVVTALLRELAFLSKGLEIVFRDERGAEPNEQVFRYEGGIVDFVAHLNASKEPLFARVIDISDAYDSGEVEIALQWNTGFYEGLHSFANNIATTEGGMHEEGFKKSL